MQLGTSLCCRGNWFEEVPSPGTHAGKLHRAWFVRKNCCVSSYAGCWLYFLHRWKNFTVAPPVNNQNDCVHVPATIMIWRRCQPTLYVPAWLSANHWGYQLLSQSWVAALLVWCLWTLAQRFYWQIVPWWTVVETIGACDRLTIRFCCLLLYKVELSCSKVGLKCVHMKPVWWYIKYTFCYQLSKVYFW